MWQDPTIKARFKAIYSFAKQTSDRISKKYPSVVFVALVGAWARGVPSNEDIDFVIAGTQYSDLREIIEESKTLNVEPPFNLRRTFICYPFSTFQDKVFSNSSKFPIIKIARVSRIIFRKLPLLKKILSYMLGPHLVKLQKFEILPQTIQTYIPFFDKDNTLAELQMKQRRILEPYLSETDLLLYSQNGFRKLIHSYLSNQVSKKDVKTTLLKSDIDWKEYLKRTIEISSQQKKEAIIELGKYLLGKNSRPLSI